MAAFKKTYNIMGELRNNTLTLRVERAEFDEFLNSEEKEFAEEINTSNWSKFCNETEDGDLEPIKFSELRLITGIADSSPSKTFKIKSAEICILTDDDGKEITYTENGMLIYAMAIVYELYK